MHHPKTNITNKRFLKYFLQTQIAFQRISYSANKSGNILSISIFYLIDEKGGRNLLSNTPANKLNSSQTTRFITFFLSSNSFPKRNTLNSFRKRAVPLQKENLEPSQHNFPESKNFTRIRFLLGPKE